MSQRKRPFIPDPVFWPIADLAQNWGVSDSMIVVLATYGTETGDKLSLSTMDVEGLQISGITVEEKRRFEEITVPRKVKRMKDLGAVERKSLQLLIGAFAVIWADHDEKYLNHPYSLLASIEKVAASNAVPMLRGDDTNAKILADSIKELRASGYVGV